MPTDAIDAGTHVTWFVYIVLTDRNTLYTGIARDPDARFAEHAAGTGAKYFRSCRPVRIVWRETQPSKSAALRRELAIKRMTRHQKQQLLQSTAIACVAAEPLA